MSDPIIINDFCDAIMLALHRAKGWITFGGMWAACRRALSKVKDPPNYVEEREEFIRRMFDNLAVLEVLDCVQVKRIRTAEGERIRRIELTDWGKEWLEKNAFPMKFPRLPCQPGGA